MTECTIIWPNGREEKYEYKNLTSLAEAQQIIGGWVEIVRVLHNGKANQMLVDEEGLLKGLLFNPKATEIYHAAAKAHNMVNDSPIVGKAILFDGEPIQ